MDSLVADHPDADAEGATSGGGKTEHFDVLIVGAGISGIGSAYHMKTQCPDRSYVVLESQESFGGTWLSHRFPGIRSDSDLYTFGYRFKPWVGPPIAVAPEIRKYMGEVIAENDLARHIRYGHKVLSAVWSSRDNLWTITAESGRPGSPVHRQLPVDVPGLLSPSGRPHARLAGHGQLQGRHRPPGELA